MGPQFLPQHSGERREAAPLLTGKVDNSAADGLLTDGRRHSLSAEMPNELAIMHSPLEGN